MQYMQNRKMRKPTVSLRLPPKLLGEVDDLVGRAHMKSRTEFLERAIEAYVQVLRNSKVVVVRTWTEPKAREAIVKLLRWKLSAFVSYIFLFSSRRRHTRLQGDWSSDVCSSD